MLELAFSGLAVIAVIAFATWLLSLALRDASIVDSVWSLLFLAAGVTWAVRAPALGPRAIPALVLLTLWALRLSGYITWRNHGEPEDARYQAIRRNHEPFWIRSLYVVFGLQGVLAFVVALPVLAALTSPRPLGLLDGLGVVLWTFGFVFETVGDAQLARFKADPAQRGRVMDRGLWRFTRHPNYFGEACVWWGFFLLAAGAGWWWTVVSPLLITFLLLKVSGVAMLERDITERRPEYARYAQRTNAFLPGRPRD